MYWRIRSALAFFKRKRDFQIGDQFLVYFAIKIKQVS
jgi:hypothetical protein